jgi:hypothetical protein
MQPTATRLYLCDIEPQTVTMADLSPAPRPRNFRQTLRTLFATIVALL